MSNWLGDIDDDALAERTSDAFYCPYTNGAKCALLVKGWQPQELCVALECDQMKLVQHGQKMRKRDIAA